MTKFKIGSWAPKKVVFIVYNENQKIAMRLCDILWEGFEISSHILYFKDDDDFEKIAEELERCERVEMIRKNIRTINILIGHDYSSEYECIKS